MFCTFDRSPSLDLALVAHEDLSRAKYVALDTAPPELSSTAPATLRQLHAVANGVPCGLVVQVRMPFDADAWELAGRK